MQLEDIGLNERYKSVKVETEEQYSTVLKLLRKKNITWKSGSNADDTFSMRYWNHTHSLLIFENTTGPISIDVTFTIKSSVNAGDNYISFDDFMRFNTSNEFPLGLEGCKLIHCSSMVEWNKVLDIFGNCGINWSSGHKAIHYKNERYGSGSVKTIGIDEKNRLYFLSREPLECIPAAWFINLNSHHIVTGVDLPSVSGIVSIKAGTILTSKHEPYKLMAVTVEDVQSEDNKIEAFVFKSSIANNRMNKIDLDHWEVVPDLILSTKINPNE